MLTPALPSMLGFKGPVFAGVLLENCKENLLNGNQNTVPGMLKSSILVQLLANKMLVVALGELPKSLVKNVDVVSV